MEVCLKACILFESANGFLGMSRNASKSLKNCAKTSLNDIRHGVTYIRSNHMTLPFLRSRIAKCQKSHVVQFNNIKKLETPNAH